ncbi:MAG TPA: hypothetical protein VIH76_01500 [Candidatus Acidoferrales bacterium]
MPSRERKDERQTHREKYEESWIRKLQTIPQFRILCERLMSGAAVAQVAREVQTWERRGECQDISFETLRVYITALNIRIQRRKCQSQTALVHVPKPTEAPPKPSEVAQAVVDVVTADKVGQFLWDKHTKHVERAEAVETKEGISLPAWYHDMHVLNDLLDTLTRRDVGQKIIDRGMPMQTQTQPLSPAAREMQHFTEVDRQLMRSAGEKLKIILQRKAVDGSLKTVDAAPDR